VSHSRPTRLIVIRHAEPDVAVRGRCYGSLDVGLSAGGREHAALLAADLARAKVDAVYASPLRRARETAAAIAARQSVPVLLDDGLRELDFGDCEGRSYEEIAATMPDLYARWMSAPTTVDFPGGEGFGALRRRAKAAATRIRGDLASRTAVVVTHGGVCRALLADVLDLRAESVFRLDIDYTRATVIDWFDDEPLVRLVNGRVTDVPPSAPRGSMQL
jgi:alpha-ribazole phosphatase